MVAMILIMTKLLCSREKVSFACRRNELRKQFCQLRSVSEQKIPSDRKIEVSESIQSYCPGCSLSPKFHYHEEGVAQQ